MQVPRSACHPHTTWAMRSCTPRSRCVHPCERHGTPADPPASRAPLRPPLGPRAAADRGDCSRDAAADRHREPRPLRRSRGSRALTACRRCRGRALARSSAGAAASAARHRSAGSDQVARSRRDAQGEVVQEPFGAKATMVSNPPVARGSRMRPGRLTGSHTCHPLAWAVDIEGSETDLEAHRHRCRGSSVEPGSLPRRARLARLR